MASCGARVRCRLDVERGGLYKRHCPRHACTFGELRVHHSIACIVFRFIFLAAMLVSCVIVVMCVLFSGSCYSGISTAHGLKLAVHSSPTYEQ